MFEHTAEGAFTLLRPILQNLEVQKYKETPKVYRASSSNHLKAAGLGKWIIIAHHTNSTDLKGRIAVNYDKTHDLFLLIIYTDKSLFANETNDLRVRRKMVAVHEFVHGAAHMFLMNFYGFRKYIELMDEAIIKKVAMTTSEQFNEMLLAIGELGTNSDVPEIFTDGHFRLLEENMKDGFLGNFVELFTNLLLSYQLISETMQNIILLHAGNIEIPSLLARTFNELVNKKALDRTFVIGRLRLFLPSLYIDFASKHTGMI